MCFHVNTFFHVGNVTSLTADRQVYGSHSCVSLENNQFGWVKIPIQVGAHQWAEPSLDEAFWHCPRSRFWLPPVFIFGVGWVYAFTVGLGVFFCKYFLASFGKQCFCSLPQANIFAC